MLSRKISLISEAGGFRGLVPALSEAGGRVIEVGVQTRCILVVVNLQFVKQNIGKLNSFV